MADDRAGLFSVLCVDDNEEVAEAVRVKLLRAGGFEWRGWLPDASLLLETALRDPPALVLLDMDMPGRDPLEVLEEVSRACPEVRAVLFSGHVRGELVERALDAGAWGYVSKNDGEDELVRSLRGVACGQVCLSPEARSAHDAR